MTGNKSPVKTLRTVGRFSTDFVVDFLMDDETNATSVSSLSGTPFSKQHPNTDLLEDEQRENKSRKTPQQSSSIQKLPRCRTPKPSTPVSASSRGSANNTPKSKMTRISSRSRANDEKPAHPTVEKLQKSHSVLKRSNTEKRHERPKVVLHRLSGDSFTAIQKKNEDGSKSRDSQHDKQKDTQVKSVSSAPGQSGRGQRRAVRKKIR